MAESKYRIIEKDEPDINTDPEEDEDDEEEDDYTEQFDDDTVTIITSAQNDVYPNKFNDVDIMQTPAAILALILVYFAFSIGLTFYQRNLLKVSAQIIYVFFSVFIFIATVAQLVPCGMCIVQSSHRSNQPHR